MPRLTHWDQFRTVRFITFSCYRRLPALRDQRACRILAEEIDHVKMKYGFRLLAYVFMPEHVHLVLDPPAGVRVGLVVREIKSKAARRYFERSGVPRNQARVFWRKRCYDRNCRDGQEVIQKIEYCHRNPVNRGLVNEPGDWKWSSYRDYTGDGSGSLRVDIVQV